MAEGPAPFSELLAGYGTTTIGDGMNVESVFALLKVRNEDGSAAWLVRSGGMPLTAEELLGVLDGLTTSMRQRLTQAWKGETPAPGPASGQHPSRSASCWPAWRRSASVAIPHRVGVRGHQGPAGRRVPVWHRAFLGDEASPEERLGALEGYAATVRQDLADKWKW